jgi:hypothetical protein
MAEMAAVSSNSGAAAASSTRQLAGKYITFKLAEEAYGLAIQ